jgi:hypothetical protein
MRPVQRVRLGRPRSALALTTVAVACALLAGCGSSATSSSTTTTPATTTTTSAQQAALQTKLLTVSDFPTGWARDTAPNAATTEGTPTCLADVVDARGSTATVHRVFVGPSTEAQGALQTVASFPAGQAAGAVARLKDGFLACNGTTFTQGEQTAHLATRVLDNLPTGPAGFAAEMELTIGTQHVFLDVFFGVTGDDATVLIWRSPGSSPALFATTAAKAMDRL